MELAKDDGDWQQDNIFWVAHEQANKLDYLRPEEKGSLGEKHVDLQVARKVSTSLIRESKDQPVEEESKRSWSGDMESIRAPWLLTVNMLAWPRRTMNSSLPPDVTFGDGAGVVASPVASGPSQALKDVLVVVLQSSLDLALWTVLDPGLPTIRH